MNMINTLKLRPRRGQSFLLACAAMLACSPVLAESDDVPDDHVTPPRLAVVEGNVQFWRPGDDAWEPAQLNAALAEGDAINVGDDGTVELQTGPRDFVRLRAGTLLTLVSHDPGMMHFQLGSGTASFDLRSSRPGQLVRIDADTANIVVGGRGYYRVETRDGETRLAVRSNGQATLTFADGRSRSVGTGEEIVVREGGGGVVVHGAPALDSWDRWNDARSDYYAAAAANRYVPDDVYGAADLDQYGRWQEDRTYGWIWVPVVASGWAPYSTGNWRWDPFYGWTWIDVAPWGWTTSHYGRWVHVGFGWAWAPGPRRVRVAYAPALVSFSYFDGGMSWFALGWGEPLVPWWGRPGFRGSHWWGGWGGPRVTVRIGGHVHSNRNIHNAVITVRDAEFGRRHVRGSSMAVPSHVERRPVVGDHPIRFDRDRRRDAMPPRPHVEPVPRQGRLIEPVPRPQRDAVPQVRPVPEFEQRGPRQQVIIPSQRPMEASPREPFPQQPRFEQRGRPPVEQRREERRFEPAAPVIQPQPRVISPTPEMRREPIAPREMPRERRLEERTIQREPQRMEMPRMETPRMEAPRPQMRSPSAPEMQQRRMPEREQGGFRDRGDRPRGPHVRD
jgi:hypothetical protein